MSTTADNVLAYLRSRPDLDLQEEGKGQYRLNSPLRPGSNSHGFTLVINDDEHGAFRDYNPKGGPESGSLYELAGLLGIEPTRKEKPTPTTKRPYTDLADYAQAHGVAVEVLVAAGWSQTTYKGRPALAIKTQTGTKYRFLDGNEPRYLKAGPPCWYGLDRAIQLANGQPLVFCNGEASTVVAQAHGVAAATTTGGEGSKLSAKHKERLLAELKAAYTGPILVALDCDDTGREGATKLAAELQQAGYDAKAVDLELGKGGDLADFCKLHQLQAAAELVKLKELSAPAVAANPETKIKSSDFITALETLGYTFRLNVLDDSVEVNGNPLNDILSAKIRTQMRDAGYGKYLTAMQDAYHAYAADNPYHPVKAYLESLVYDGLPHIDVLASYFLDEQKIFGLWLKKWLVGSIAKIYQQAQNPMLVLDGAQGKGKSQFAAWLCPLNGHFVEGAIQPENNDHRLLLATSWIWEVSELGATTRRADREALKQFITQKTIKARKPYGQYPICKASMTSFIGTVNDEAGFLNDPTGSRRFLTCTLTKINWDYTQTNINDIWAESMHLYRTGYNWWLSPDEQKLQAEINEHYELEDPLIPIVLKHYARTNNPNDWVSSVEILERVGMDPAKKQNAQLLGQAMRKLGVTKQKQRLTDGSRPNGYLGLKSRLY